jgi:lysozyme
MKVNKEGIELLHHFESCKLEAYLCPAKVWTVGWGNTRYEDGTPVKLGDKITQERADELFLNILNTFEKGVASRVKKELNSNQFSALVCIAYNIGLGNFGASTLLKRVNANPSDPDIRNQFGVWNKSKGVVLNGLVRRRKAEADLYFS